MCRYLTVSCQPYHSSVLFFIAIKLDGTTVITHFSKGKANHLLLFFSYGTALLLNLVVNFRAEAHHYFVTDTLQVCHPHIVVNARDAPRKTLLTLLFIVRTWLCTRYHFPVQHHIPFPPTRLKHRVGCMAQTLVGFLAVSASTVCVVNV